MLWTIPYVPIWEPKRKTRNPMWFQVRDTVVLYLLCDKHKRKRKKKKKKSPTMSIYMVGW